MNKYLRIGTWNWWRISRLILGIVFAIVGISRADYILIAAGVFLVAHAWVNACAACVDNSCELTKTEKNE